MDLTALQTFLAVVDRGSLLGGAEALGASRATVRRHLELLEADVGAALLHRGPRGVAPTAAGELLARRGRPILAEAQVLREAVRSMGEAPVGTVRAHGPVGLPPVAIATMISALRLRWPGLKLDLTFSDRPQDALMAGAELVLSADPEPPDGPFVCVELPPVREGLWASPDYLARHGAPATPEALSGHPLLMWSPPEGAPARLPLLGGGTIAVQPVLTSNDIHLLRLAAAAGAGIAYTPGAPIPEPGTADDALLPVLPDRVGALRPIRLVTPRALASLPKIHALLDAARSFLPAPPPSEPHSQAARPFMVIQAPPSTTRTEPVT